DEDTEGGELPQYITYTISASDVYKGKSTVADGEEIEVTTAFFSSACGVDLLEEEYLLGIFLDDDGELLMNACGLVRAWSTLSDEAKATLESGCD
ncbi:unnamed protein product, partial [Laminaria digitata]